MQLLRKVSLAFLALTMMLLVFGASAESFVELPTSGLGVSANITVNVPGENPVEDGINPLTGEKWYGQYTPILVSTDNHPDALPHWGVSSADMIYEFPIQMDGSTRMIAVYMSDIPNYVGPVRSGRVIMAKLREMWDAGWVFYGWQSSFGSEPAPSVDVMDFADEVIPSARSKGRWVFPYVEGMEANYGKYFHRENDGNHVAPHNVQVDLRAIASLFPRESVKHPFKFTDEGLDHGLDVSSVTINYKTTNPAYVTGFVYNEITGLYDRKANGEDYYDALNGQTVDFANVIIIRTNITNLGNNASRVIIQSYGQGSAEIFQNGKYIRGTWVHTNNPSHADEYDSLGYRMIFLDDQGNELEMKVGKTAICFVNLDWPVIVQTGESISGGKVLGTPAPTATPKPTRAPKPTRTPKPGQATPAPVTDNATTEEDEDFFGGF